LAEQTNEHEHAHHQHASHQAHDSQKAKYPFGITPQIATLLLIAAFIIIGIVIIYLRTGLLQYAGFFEPDGFFHYSVIEQTIANHFIEPLYSSLSGWPGPKSYIADSDGLYYATIIPYILLSPFGVKLYDIFRLVPILFGLLDGIAAYFLVKYLSKSRILGLLAMFFVGVSSGNVARTAGLVYRGDTFASVFVMAALILMMMALQAEDERKLYIWTALSALVLSLTLVVWLGGAFGLVIYLMAVVLVGIYGFVKWDSELLKKSLFLSIGLLFAYLLDHIFLYLTIIRSAWTLSGIGFLGFCLPVIISLAISYFVSLRLKGGKTADLLSTWYSRLIIVAFVILIAVGIGFGAYGSFIKEIAGGGGGVIANNQIGATTQELLPPNWAFIWASFGYQIFLAPIGVLICIGVMVVDYFFKKKSDSKMMIPFLVLFSYLAVTGYLQSNAVRYNSLLSIPIALFAAYAIYAIGTIVYSLAKRFDSKEGLYCYAMLGVYVLLVLLLLWTSFNLSAFQSFHTGQADDLNPYFLQAVGWLRNDTPTNASVLALWPDGSVVEGWGYRSSYLDSVGGENGSRIINNSAFLFNTTNDQQYLVNIGKPDYILARGYWMSELGGIAVEGGITNITDYGYNQLTSFGQVEKQGNETIYSLFTNSTPSYSTKVVIDPLANGTFNATSYLSVGGSNFYEMRSTLFYNTINGAYQFFNRSTNGTVNYTEMIFFQNSSIDGAQVLGPKLTQTNLFKFLYLCNAQGCPFDDGTASLQLVYINADSRIYKVYYGNES
jgi:hypothetical protein